MTDLTAYESALVERVARAMHETAPTGEAFDALAPKEAGGLRDDAAHVLRALGLLGPSRTAWLAPWEASEEMQDDAAAAFDDARTMTRALRKRRNDKLEAGGRSRMIDEGLFCGADWTPAVFSAMRDANLKETKP